MNAANSWMIKESETVPLTAHTYELAREHGPWALWCQAEAGWREVYTGTAHGWRVCCPGCVADVPAAEVRDCAAPRDGTRCYLCGEAGEDTIYRVRARITHIDRQAGQVWWPSGERPAGRYVAPITPAGIEYVGGRECSMREARRWWGHMLADEEAARAEYARHRAGQTDTCALCGGILHAEHHCKVMLSAAKDGNDDE